MRLKTTVIEVLVFTKYDVSVLGAYKCCSDLSHLHPALAC